MKRKLFLIVFCLLLIFMQSTSSLAFDYQYLTKEDKEEIYKVLNDYFSEKELDTSILEEMWIIDKDKKIILATATTYKQLENNDVFYEVYDPNLREIRNKEKYKCILYYKDKKWNIVDINKNIDMLDLKILGKENYKKIINDKMKNGWDSLFLYNTGMRFLNRYQYKEDNSKINILRYYYNTESKYKGLQTETEIGYDEIDLVKSICENYFSGINKKLLIISYDIADNYDGRQFLVLNLLSRTKEIDWKSSDWILDKELYYISKQYHIVLERNLAGEWHPLQFSFGEDIYKNSCLNDEIKDMLKNVWTKNGFGTHPINKFIYLK